MQYHPRLIDDMLAKRLKSAGAVLIEGAKGCGKTETATKAAKSAVRFDADEQVRVMMQIDPRMVLEGEAPRLIDEWQVYPEIWDYVRRAVDERKQKGQFILTGSASPSDYSGRHSGVGRFSLIRMYPMTSFERGWSSGEVSLRALMLGESPASGDVGFDISDFAEKISIGGWPGNIGCSADEGLQYSRDYMNLIAEIDISNVSNRRRDPNKVMRLLQSLARNVSTEVSIAELSRDTGGTDSALDVATVSDYLSALERLMVVDNVPAWNTHIRSSHMLRKAPKRHFVDPSLAVGALGLSVDKIVSDLTFYGLLFESLAIRDIRIYASVDLAKVYHYRDSSGLEVDCIVEAAAGTWSAFEIKLGIGAADEAAKNLLALAAAVDEKKASSLTSLNVITANGFAHRRPDGVNVVPLSTLTV